MDDDLHWNTTSNGRHTQMEDEPQWKTKPPMKDDIRWKKTSNGRRHLMEDNLEILKVKYIGNHFLDQTQT